MRFKAVIGVVQLLALGLALGLLSWACAGEAQEESLPNGITIAVTTPSPTPIPTPMATPLATSTPMLSPTPTPTPLANVCLFNPDPATPEELQILAPSLAEGQQVLGVRSPIRVVGWSSDIQREDIGVTIALVVLTDDQMEPLPIFDTEGQPMLTVDANALPAEGQAPPPGLKATEFTAPFAEDIGFQVKEPKAACLWVFVQPVGSAEAQDVVQVPLQLLP